MSKPLRKSGSVRTMESVVAKFLRPLSHYREESCEDRVMEITNRQELATDLLFDLL